MQDQNIMGRTFTHPEKMNFSTQPAEVSDSASEVKGEQEKKED
jgi:hypothetical protein